MTHTRRIAALIFALAFLAMPIAHIEARADITVAVTISGTVDELTSILELLKTLGIGLDEIVTTEDGLPVNLHSILLQNNREAAADAPAPKAPLAFLAAQTVPNGISPGNEVFVTVEVSDPDKVVDTVVATLAGVGEVDYDLYDNGTRGDAIAGDGIWSLALPVPPSAGAGSYVLSFAAYDRMGDLVQVQDASGAQHPLSLLTTFEVKN